MLKQSIEQVLGGYLEARRKAQITAYYKERAEEYDQLTEGLKKAATNVASGQEKDEYTD